MDPKEAGEPARAVEVVDKEDGLARLDHLLGHDPVLLSRPIGAVQQQHREATSARSWRVEPLWLIGKLPLWTAPVWAGARRPFGCMVRPSGREQ